MDVDSLMGALRVVQRAQEQPVDQFSPVTDPIPDSPPGLTNYEADRRNCPNNKSEIRELSPATAPFVDSVAERAKEDVANSTEGTASPSTRSDNKSDESTVEPPAPQTTIFVQPTKFLDKADHDIYRRVTRNIIEDAHTTEQAAGRFKKRLQANINAIADVKQSAIRSDGSISSTEILTKIQHFEENETKLLKNLADGRKDLEGVKARDASFTKVMKEHEIISLFEWKAATTEMGSAFHEMEMMFKLMVRELTELYRASMQRPSLKGRSERKWKERKRSENRDVLDGVSAVS